MKMRVHWDMWIIGIAMKMRVHWEFCKLGIRCSHEDVISDGDFNMCIKVLHELSELDTICWH